MPRTAMLVLLASCARFDPAEPIELIPASSWSDTEVATLAAAAECWTLQFGIPFEVAAEQSRAQAVLVDYNDFICWTSPGRFTPGQLATIDVCPYSKVQTYHAPLIRVLTHELGHAAGIRVHGNTGVMGPDRPPWDTLFSVEDRQLLHDADPSFVPTPACADVKVGPDPLTGTSCRCPETF